MKVNEKWSTLDKQYSVIFSHPQSLLDNSSLFNNKDQETGGILIGYYTQNKKTAVITNMTGPPPDSSYGFSHFIRGATGLKSLLKKLWHQKRRTYYIGEWHYHPSMCLTPSICDLNQMIEISGASNYQCNEPILIIVGRSANSEIPLRVFVFPREADYAELFKMRT